MRGYDEQPERVKEWINWLGEYCQNQGERGPVPGWMNTDAADDERQTAADVVERINEAGVTTLGRIAIVSAGGHPPDTNHLAEDEGDPFPWLDSATWWSGEQEPDQETLLHLFDEVPDEQIGSVEDIGWFGLLRDDGWPGGIVLSQNNHGIRRAYRMRSDDELTAAWQRIQDEYEAFNQAVRVNNHQSGDREGAPEHAETISGHHPQIWVASLADYTNGHLHGVWLDATLDPAELDQAVAFMLRNGYTPDAQEWAVYDYHDFCGLDLGEYVPMSRISRIACGIAEHGDAFAAWAEYVGTDAEDELDRFGDCYLGRYDSVEAYAEQLLEEADAYSYFDAVPESLRQYAIYDIEHITLDIEHDLHVELASGGGVHVFNTRG